MCDTTNVLLQNDSSNTADGKNSKKKKSTNVSASKKPFTELLKHFETSGSEQSSSKSYTDCTTTVSLVDFALAEASLSVCNLSETAF